MINDISNLRVGLILAMLTLIFGIAMGVLFGTNEDGVKGFIAEGIATHQTLHDEKSQSKIWRYAQRAHFHATGVSAFALVLILMTGVTTLSRKMKFVASTLIGIGSFYPLAWFSMFLLSPTMGRDAAHHAFITELITKVTVGCLSAGILLVMVGLVYNPGRSSDSQILDSNAA